MWFWSLTRVTALLGAWLMHSTSAGLPADAEKAPNAIVVAR